MRKYFSIVLLCLLVLPSFQGRAEERLTVLTWNTGRMDYKHKSEQNAVLRFLMEQDADIICLQEVDVYKDAHFITLAEVRQVLRRKYPYSYIDFSQYDKRHQFGLMVWSKYPLINKQTLHYEWKGNISDRCDVVIGQDTIRLLNNHLQSYSFTAKDMEEFDRTHSYEGLKATFYRLKAKWEHALPLRNEQARVVRKEIDASPYPVIVVGDFNSIALSYAYWHISRGLHDAWRAIHPFRYGATCEHRGVGARIDYILCSESLRPLDCVIKETTASDHKPVVATLQL